jgi:putative ABC transport system permease protein
MNVVRDIRYALRTLAKRLKFAIQALATIAIGIATNTVVFTMMNSVLLRGLDFRDPGRLVRI